jgi:hypothetical protein
MTKTEFEASFGLLENAFGIQNPERRQFYFRQFQYTAAWAFDRAVRRIVEIRDDGYGFPLVAEISTAIDEVQRARSQADDSDMGAREFCQRCGNFGMVPTDGMNSAFCSCRMGRLKQARLRVGLTARRSEVEEEVKKLPPAEPPFRGLQEKNPLGFWESTADEHEAWCAEKRAEIEEIKRRREEEPKRTSSVSDELRFKEISEAAARVKFGERFLAPAAGEPATAEEEDDNIPF